MKTDPRPWLSPPLKRKSSLGKIPILRIFVWTMAYHNYYYLSGWNLGHLEEPTHSEFHPSQKESFWRSSRCESSETTWPVLERYRALHEIFHSLSLCTILRSSAIESSSSYSAPRAISFILRIKSVLFSSLWIFLWILHWSIDLE